MTRSSSSKYRLFAAGTALAFAFGGLAAGLAQGQMVVPKSKLPPTKAVVKPRENVLAQFPLGEAGRLQREIVALVNKARQEARLAPLPVHRTLTATAQRYADRMAKDDKLSPEITLMSVASRFGSPSAQDVVTGWLLSPRDRAIILNPNLLDMSVGVARSARSGRSYFCLVFREAW